MQWYETGLGDTVLDRPWTLAEAAARAAEQNLTPLPQTQAALQTQEGFPGILSTATTYKPSIFSTATPFTQKSPSILFFAVPKGCPAGSTLVTVRLSDEVSTRKICKPTCGSGTVAQVIGRTSDPKTADTWTYSGKCVPGMTMPKPDSTLGSKAAAVIVQEFVDDTGTAYAEPVEVVEEAGILSGIPLTHILIGLGVGVVGYFGYRWYQNRGKR